MVVGSGFDRQPSHPGRWFAATLLVVAVSACSGSPVSPTPPPSLSPGSVLFVARGTAFLTTSPIVPANTEWTLVFDNEDNLPHNVVIQDANGQTVFSSDVFTGPGLRTQAAPTLAPGNYTFVCAIHSGMKGTLTAE